MNAVGTRQKAEAAEREKHHVLNGRSVQVVVADLTLLLLVLPRRDELNIYDTKKRFVAVLFVFLLFLLFLLLLLLFLLLLLLFLLFLLLLFFRLLLSATVFSGSGRCKSFFTHCSYGKSTSAPGSGTVHAPSSATAAAATRRRPCHNDCNLSGPGNAEEERNEKRKKRKKRKTHTKHARSRHKAQSAKHRKTQNKKQHKKSGENVIRAPTVDDTRGSLEHTTMENE